MKNDLSAISYFWAREGFANYINALFNCLPEEVITDKNSSPLFIKIIGDYASGKSLIWDESKNALLKLPSIKVHSLASDSARKFEYHTGLFKKTNTPITFLFQRVGTDYSAGQKNTLDECISEEQKLKIPNHRKYGDILLLSYLKDFSRNSIKPDIEINLRKSFNTSFILSPIVHSIAPWARTIRTSIVSDRLKNSDSIQKFMTQ